MKLLTPFVLVSITTVLRLGVQSVFVFYNNLILPMESLIKAALACETKPPA